MKATSISYFIMQLTHCCTLITNKISIFKYQESGKMAFSLGAVLILFLVVLYLSIINKVYGCKYCNVNFTNVQHALLSVHTFILLLRSKISLD